MSREINDCSTPHNETIVIGAEARSSSCTRASAQSPDEAGAIERHGDSADSGVFRSNVVPKVNRTALTRRVLRQTRNTFSRPAAPQPAAIDARHGQILTSG
ncbi:hypothetical protein [Bradyrhizobium sp. 2TAF24]|uniref:hypothetical protein n=1 Tax=Bradyrhizobium sp. 2TAF24 TaxID=3233011 RepID=UPI003F9342D8